MELKPEDMKWEVFPHGKDWAGGQHTNGGDVGIKGTHLPTRTEVYCDMHRSQFKNRKTILEMIEWAIADW